MNAKEIHGRTPLMKLCVLASLVYDNKVVVPLAHYDCLWLLLKAIPRVIWFGLMRGGIFDATEAAFSRF